jgi:Rrf2 family protein
MKVSTKGRYGLRIMLELALRHGAGPVLVPDIARNQDLPLKYVHVLAGGLKAAGLLRTVRGPGGGLELARDPEAITPLDVVEALEGRIAGVDCTRDPGLCPRAAECVAREVWGEMADAMARALARRNLAELADQVRSRSGGLEAYMI